MRPIAHVPIARADRPQPPRAHRRNVFLEFCRALLASKRWWLIPMVAVLALSAALLAAVAAVEYVAPFVYTIF
jgi:uncharacterized membrane protein YqhA